MHRLYYNLERSYNQPHNQDKHFKGLKTKLVSKIRDTHLLGSIPGGGEQDFSSSNVLRKKRVSREKGDWIRRCSLEERLRNLLLNSVWSQGLLQLLTEGGGKARTDTRKWYISYDTIFVRVLLRNRTSRSRDFKELTSAIVAPGKSIIRITGQKS